MKVGDCEIYFECTMHNCDARPERRRREGRRKKKYTSDHPPLLCDLIFSNLSYVSNLSTRSNLTSVLRCYTYILDVLVLLVSTEHAFNASWGLCSLLLLESVLNAGPE